MKSSPRGRNAERGLSRLVNAVAAETPPRPRPCAVCGGPLRRSHVVYLGRNQEATVYRCQSCGNTEQGPPRDRTEAQQKRAEQGRGGRRRERRPLDAGAPENPVIDSDMARLLRERFGSGGEGQGEG